MLFDATTPEYVLEHIVVLEAVSADELWTKRMEKPVKLEEAQELVLVMGEGRWRLKTVSIERDEGIFVVEVY